MNSEFCSQCGHKNYFDIKPSFCSKCGQPFNRASGGSSSVSTASRIDNTSDDYDLNEIKQGFQVSDGSLVAAPFKLKDIVGIGGGDNIGNRPRYDAKGKSALRALEEECDTKQVTIEYDKTGDD